MSLQVELSSTSSRTVFKPLNEPPDPRVTSQARGSVDARCARSTEAIESGEAHAPEIAQMRGTAAGGFMCVIVRRITMPFMSRSDTTPAPNMTATHSYLAAVRRTDTPVASRWSIHDAPESQIDRAPPWAHPAPATLRQLSRELPRRNGQSRRRHQHRGCDGP